MQGADVFLVLTGLSLGTPIVCGQPTEAPPLSFDAVSIKPLPPGGGRGAGVPPPCAPLRATSSAPTSTNPRPRKSG